MSVFSVLLPFILLSGNPAPVLDATTGKIILAYCRDNKQVFTIESSDEGANWGNVSNITAAVTEPDWNFVGTGPPGGIQLPSGRLIIGKVYTYI